MIKRHWSILIIIVLFAGMSPVGDGGAGLGEDDSDYESFDWADAAKPIPLKVKFQPTEMEVVTWAVDALTTYKEEDRPFIRFIWIPPWGDYDWLGVMDYAVNAACGQGSSIIHGDRHANNWLLGYNLRHLAPDSPEQLKTLLETWDGLALIESRFHVTKTNLDKGGKGHALLAPHLEKALLAYADGKPGGVRADAMVAQLTRSTGGVYPADFMLEQLLTSIRGKYPEFRQIKFKTDKLTPLQTELARLGFFYEASKSVGGLQGAMLLRSDVTGKPRIIMTAGGVGNGMAAFTFDVLDERLQAAEQMPRNLLEFEAVTDAAEIFAIQKNKLIEFLLANGKGEITREAPFNVANDTTIPRPHTQRLEMGMSCIICHAPEDGYKTVKNDLDFLLRSDVDFFGETTTYHKGKKQVTLTKEQALDLMVGLYAQPIDGPDGRLDRARHDYIKIINQFMGFDPGDNRSSVHRLGVKIKEIYHGYRYKRYNAERVCLDLGMVVPPKLAATGLKALVPPRKKGSSEDLVLSLLRNGATISRDELDNLRLECARRAAETRPGLLRKANAAVSRTTLERRPKNEKFTGVIYDAEPSRN